MDYVYILKIERYLRYLGNKWFELFYILFAFYRVFTILNLIKYYFINIKQDYLEKILQVNVVLRIIDAQSPSKRKFELFYKRLYLYISLKQKDNFFEILRLYCLDYFMYCLHSLFYRMYSEYMSESTKYYCINRKQDYLQEILYK